MEDFYKAAIFLVGTLNCEVTNIKASRVIDSQIKRLVAHSYGESFLFISFTRYTFKWYLQNKFCTLVKHTFN